MCVDAIRLEDGASSGVGRKRLTYYNTFAQPEMFRREEARLANCEEISDTSFDQANYKIVMLFITVYNNLLYLRNI